MTPRRTRAVVTIQTADGPVGITLDDIVRRLDSVLNLLAVGNWRLAEGIASDLADELWEGMT